MIHTFRKWDAVWDLVNLIGVVEQIVKALSDRLCDYSSQSSRGILQPLVVASCIDNHVSLMFLQAFP